ncbi:MAG: hypothetical protein EOP42_00840 [Sphingobacteriaceae bacterium]|nr:MAG: hypothetical protein EOP42_00840 [Sphingobacteriaceae bacterium]
MALIFVFNHKYDRNIDILEKLYKDRFSNIYHLVPFYEGNKENVIPVYESSQHFQGYLAQGYKKYFREEYEHYIFIGDDLILNPAINEDNYQTYFHLTKNTSYIPEIYSLHHLTNNNTLRFLPVKSITGKNRWHWCKIKEMVDSYKHKAYGVENADEMPSYLQAKALIEKHGYPIQSVSYKDLYGDVIPFTSAAVKYALNLTSYFKRFALAYPVVGSYSDIVIVAKTSIKKFCHYCGVFATNKLFVEFAIPTSLLLASEKVITEREIGKKGKIYWLYTKPEIDNYEQDIKPYNQDLNKLINEFPADKLYIHPIKLSKWKV